MLALDAVVTRDEFDAWIAEELAGVAACVDGLLETSGVAFADVDRVFLTGGTSFVPLIRQRKPEA